MIILFKETNCMAATDNILLKLRDYKDSLTPAERKVAEYVLEYPEEVPKCSIKKLAIKSKTSDASVVRLCKTLGFEGFREFIVRISAETASKDFEPDDEYKDIQPGDDLNLIIRNVSKNNCKSIEDTLSIIDKASISEAVDLLSSSKRIFFYGIGASGLVCMDAQQKFMRINKNCLACTDGHTQLTSACMLTSEDVAVFISNTGNTKEIVDTLKLVRDSKATIIAITKYGKSILSENSDIVLYFSTPEVSIRSGAMGSRIAMLNIIDILFSGVASTEYKSIRKYLDKTHNVLLDKHLK